MKKLILLVMAFMYFGCSSTKEQPADNDKNESINEQDQVNIPKTNLSDLESECRSQETSRALKMLSTQYVNYKNDPNYWNLIGACFLNDERPLKARLFFLRALEADKSNAAALNNLGFVYWKMSKHYEALAYFKRAEAADSSAIAVKYNLARLYSWYGLHKISNQKFYETPPSYLSPQDYSYIGVNQAMLDQNENAVKSFSGTKINNKKAQAVFAVALKRVGRAEDALDNWKQARVSSTDSLSWLWLMGE